MSSVRKNRVVEPRRSVCPVACGLDLFGDRWTLLIVRDLMCGRSRFKDLIASPEGIATNLLSERLARLIRHAIIERVQSADGSKHQAYRLTPKGEALRPLLAAMRDWGLRWEVGTDARLSPLPADRTPAARASGGASLASGDTSRAGRSRTR